MEKYITFLAVQFPAMSVFATFFISSSSPFKVTFTHASIKNDFSQCQLNPMPTSVLFKKNKLFLSFRMASWSLHDCHVLKNQQNKEDLLHNQLKVINKFVVLRIFSGNHKIAGGVRIHICFTANGFQSVSTKPSAYQCFILKK